MIILGLTGSIGMGKTTASKMLKKLGCAIHNADACVARALSPKGKAFELVALSFPESWDKKNHVIKKDILAELIFNDEAKKEELESILHPIVRADQQEFLNKQRRLGRRISVLDIPLLFETGGQSLVDYTICVSAPYFIQAQRVLSRSNMDEQKFKDILAAQMPDVQKRRLADFVVHTGLGLGFTFKSLQKIVKSVS